MKAKDRITAYICTNSDGSRKVPISIIGLSKKQRAFTCKQPPCKYFHSKKAWSNTQLFERWVHEVFMPFILTFTRDKVARLVDNASSHDKILLPRKIELICLPPNSTSIHQPMGMGIIRAWKASYRRLMLRKVLQHIETVLERRHAKREAKED